MVVGKYSMVMGYIGTGGYVLQHRVLELLG